MIPQKLGGVAVGMVLLIVVLSVGCLGSDGQKPDLNNASVQPSPSLSPVQTVTETVTIQQNLTVAPVVGPCSATLVPGQNVTINETQDGTTICAKPGSSLTLELVDASRTGHQWIMNASPGLQITDEGVTLYHYYMNGTPLTEEAAETYNGPGMERGIDRWNVSMTNTGVQTINANLQFYITNEPRTEKTLNWTIVVS